jgi:hypothetical protein
MTEPIQHHLILARHDVLVRRSGPTALRRARCSLPPGGRCQRSLHTVPGESMHDNNAQAGKNQSIGRAIGRWTGILMSNHISFAVRRFPHRPFLERHPRRCATAPSKCDG